MVLTFPIACKCISQSIAQNRYGCIDSRAKRSPLQCVSSTQCDLMRWSWQRALRSDGREWARTKEGVGLLQLTCGHAIVRARVSSLHLWGVNTGEALSGCSAEGLHRATPLTFPPSREAVAATLQVRRFLLRCRRRSGPLSASPLPFHRGWSCSCRHLVHFWFPF